MEQLNPPEALAMPFANNGTKNSIPVSPTGTNKASLAEGFPLLTSTPSSEGGIPPARGDFNGVENMNSQFYFAFQNGWLPTFNSAVSTAIGGYPLGAKLWYVDAQGGVNMLVSLKGNNTDNFIMDPSVIGTSWKPLMVTQDYIAQNYVNKSGDTMTGQLVMENGSNGIRFNGTYTTGGWVGGDPSLTDDEKELLYNFYYVDEYKTFVAEHPLGSGQAYTLYEGTRQNPGEVINLMAIGWKDTSNVWCSVELGTTGTNTTAPWWDTPKTGETITKTLPINQSMAPTSYQEESTANNYYYVKYGPQGIQQGDNRILTTADIGTNISANPTYQAIWNGSSTNLTLPEPLTLGNFFIIFFIQGNRDNAQFQFTYWAPVLTSGMYIGWYNRGGENADRNYDSKMQLTITDGQLTKLIAVPANNCTIKEIGIVKF